VTRLDETVQLVAVFLREVCCMSSVLFTGSSVLEVITIACGLYVVSCIWVSC